MRTWNLLRHRTCSLRCLSQSLFPTFGRQNVVHGMSELSYENWYGSQESHECQPLACKEGFCRNGGLGLAQTHMAYCYWTALLSRVTMAELVATKNRATSALAPLTIPVFSVKTKNRVATPPHVTIAPCVKTNLVRVSSLVSAERAALDPTVAALWIHVQTILVPTLPNAFHSNKDASSASVELAGSSL